VAVADELCRSRVDLPIKEVKSARIFAVLANATLLMSAGGDTFGLLGDSTGMNALAN
jgi:peptidase E